jgi:hypothetical protein
LADSIRDNVLRGMALAAEAGRPHGRVTYGYRRVYNTRTRALERQELDTEIREATAPDGTVTEYSRAAVMKDIYDMLGSGVPITKIDVQLNEKGIPAPSGTEWRSPAIRRMLLNPAYIGKRVYQGQVVGDGMWPALVDEETYWAVVRLLEDPARKTWRPARARHLLTYIVRCGVCGGPLSKTTVNRRNWSGRVYTCMKKRCVGAIEGRFEEYVERTVVAWLALPATVEMLTALSGGDEQATHARAQAQRLRADLEDWRKLAESGDVSAVSFARTEKGLLAQIAAHEKAVSEAGIPPVLRGRIGAQAVQAWADLADDLPVKREIITTIAQIKLLPVGKGSRRPFDAGRLDWRWRLGGDQAA